MASRSENAYHNPHRFRPFGSPEIADHPPHLAALSSAPVVKNGQVRLRWETMSKGLCYTCSNGARII